MFAVLWPERSSAIIDHLGRALTRFKLGTHFFDLGGLLLQPDCESLCLLSKVPCESLYLFLLPGDRCFQLFDFANFALQCAGRSWYARSATTLRGGTLHRFVTTLARAKIPAKVVVCHIHSNLYNRASNRLEVVEDTTDVTF